MHRREGLGLWPHNFQCLFIQGNELIGKQCHIHITIHLYNSVHKINYNHADLTSGTYIRASLEMQQMDSLHTEFIVHLNILPSIGSGPRPSKSPCHDQYSLTNLRCSSLSASSLVNVKDGASTFQSSTS